MMHNTSRRTLLKRTAALSALAFPTIIPASVLGAGAPSKRANLGHIGVGGQGTGVMRGCLGLSNSQSIAVCDPIPDRRDNAASLVNNYYANQKDRADYKGCRPYNDYREMLDNPSLDAVVVASPDHWHVPLAIAAVKAGKDVYVEKPLGISMELDKLLRQTVHRYNAVFQYGTQQRSFSQHCGFACELARNGHLGDLKAIHVVAPNGATGGRSDPQPVPPGMDYDLWLGPAPFAPYTHDRVLGGGRWHIHDYALGFIAGWGAHPLDIAHWGYPHIPVEYEGTGRIPADGLFDTVVDWDIKGRYASGIEFTLKAGGDKTTFVGTDGWVAASRGGIEASSPTLLKVKLKPDEIHLLDERHHYGNFVNCVLSRRTPVSDIDSAVQSDFMSHLSDIAIRLRRKIKWDPAIETIVDDEQARRMMSRASREPYVI